MSLVITQNAVLGARDCPVIKPHFARIGWNNKTLSITASSEVAGFEADNALTQQDYQYWVPGSMPATAEIALSGAVSFVGIAASDLSVKGVVVKCEYYDGSNWQLIGEVIPGNDYSLMFIFGEVTSEKIRLTFTGQDAPKIGVIQAGDVITIPANIESGFVDLKLNRDTKFDNNISENGKLLGRRVLRTSLTGSPEWKIIEYDWVAQYFFDFMIYAETHAYFFAQNPLDEPDAVYYCWSNTSLFDALGSRSRQYLPITIPMEAYIE